MEKIIMARCGELMLKGLNRSYFESKLTENIKSAISGLGSARVIQSHGRIYIEPISNDFKFDNALKAVSRVFGIVSLSPVYKIQTDYDAIMQGPLSRRRYSKETRLRHSKLKQTGPTRNSL